MSSVQRLLANRTVLNEFVFRVVFLMAEYFFHSLYIRVHDGDSADVLKSNIEWVLVNAHSKPSERLLFDTTDQRISNVDGNGAPFQEVRAFVLSKLSPKT